ncbi:MAG: hypothetical protein ACMG55_02580 [Microcoleus sp.]
MLNRQGCKQSSISRSRQSDRAIAPQSILDLGLRIWDYSNS